MYVIECMTIEMFRHVENNDLRAIDDDIFDIQCCELIHTTFPYTIIQLNKLSLNRSLQLVGTVD